MVSKGFSLVAAAAVLMSFTIGEQALAKAHKGTANRSRGNYFVPPPPPYAPSILPETLHYGTGGTTTIASALDSEEAPPKPPENPYRKYIFTPNANDTPHVVKPNKYVSYWGKTSK